MPRKKHMCTIVVFDINSKEEFKQEAIKCYLSICGLRQFTNCTDCSQLILINTAETSNKMNNKNSGKYLHIVEATEAIVYNVKNMKYIEDATPAPGNWIEGVNVAVEELLINSDSNSFDTFQIIVFSDLSTALSMEKAEIKTIMKNIIKQLCLIDGYIYFLGPDIPISKMLCTKADVYDWAINLDIDGKNENIRIASEILQESYGVMCDLSVGIELVQSYKYSKRGFPFAEPLKFGELEIYTACMKHIDTKSTSLNPKRDKTGIAGKIYVDAEDQSEEVDPINTIRGLALHNKLVIIPYDVSKGVKTYSRFFKLLGFTDMSNVHEDYMLASNTNLVTVYETKDPEIGAINYIIKACHKLEKYGIALRAYNKNSRPKLYCLIPKLDPLCFIAVELPYAEDIQIVYAIKNNSSIKFRDDVYSGYENVAELKDDIYAYLDSVDMDGKTKVHPYLRGSSGKRKIIDNLVRKIRGEEIVQSTLSLGDLEMISSEELYGAINERWFAKNQSSEIAME